MDTYDYVLNLLRYVVYTILSIQFSARSGKEKLHCEELCLTLWHVHRYSMNQHVSNHMPPALIQQKCPLDCSFLLFLCKVQVSSHDPTPPPPVPSQGFMRAQRNPLPEVTQERSETYHARTAVGRRNSGAY